MRAVGIRAFGGRERLERLDLPVPEVGPEDVLIRVRAAGVNPIDWKIRQGLLQARIPHRFPIVLGWDAAGTVERVGERCSRLRPGEEVWAYARLPVVQHGTYAEYVAVPESSVAQKPRSLDLVEAAVVPLAALTAWQTLVEAAGVREGDVVLVDAAAGGVGTFAVQIARARGAEVLGVAGPRNRDHLRSLGCAEVLDHAGDLVAAVRRARPRGVDVVLDMHGGERMRALVDVVRDGGRLVGIAQPPQGPRFEERGIRSAYVFVSPDAGHLEALGRMCDEGRLRIHLDDVFALERAAEAHERLEAQHVRGKLALLV